MLCTQYLGYDSSRDHVSELPNGGVHIFHVNDLFLLRKGYGGGGAFPLPAFLVLLDANHGDLSVVSGVILSQILRKGGRGGGGG